ncbi:unnamed protein product [Calicophoron daubneyi]|uniref:Uncharacterized protein n=1 Tax=Calicophoron daubneyi TaxID=300641 RepID=A0AAV2TNW1_CALDB
MNYIEEHYKKQNSTDNPRMHDQKNATMLNGENSGPKKQKTIPYIVMVGVLEYLGVITKRIDYLTDIIVALAFASLLPFILGLLFGIRLIIRIRELTEAN